MQGGGWRGVVRGGSGAFRSDFLSFLDKEPDGKGRWEDPELFGMFSLLFLVRNLKEKAGGRIRSFPECFPYCF